MWKFFVTSVILYIAWEFGVRSFFQVPSLPLLSCGGIVACLMFLQFVFE